MDLASQKRYGGGGWVDFEDFVQDLANSESDFSDMLDAVHGLST